MAEKIVSETRPKTGDRKRKGASEKPRKVMAFRVNDELYQQLETQSQRRGFSLSEEIEARLTASFRSAADPYIGAAFTMAEANCDVIQRLLGKNIAEDPFTRAACAKAASAAIELVGGLAGQDTPETRALLQTEAEAFGQVVAMFVQTVRDGIKNDFTETLGEVAEFVAARRKAEVEQQASDRRAAARLLREGAPAQPATPEEIAGMVDARSPEATEPAPAPKRRARAKVEAASE